MTAPPLLLAPTVGVGINPTAIAIAQDTLVCVVCTGAGRVTVFDVLHPSMTPSSVGVGSNPVAIAIAENRFAYVCNKDDNTVTVLDPSNPSSQSFYIGVSPVAVAILTPPVVEKPRAFKGKIHRHGTEGTLKMKWKQSASPDIASYEIFAYSDCIASIPAGGPFRFKRHLHSPYLLRACLPEKFIHQLENKYRIRAVNANGVVSAIEFLKIKSE